MKKLFSLFLFGVLAVCLCVPAFAAEAKGGPALQSGVTYRFSTAEKAGLYLNVYGNGNAQDNVTLYAGTSNKDQAWKMITCEGNKGGFYCTSALNPALALNINHSTNNCNLYPYDNNYTGGSHDSAMNIGTNNTIRLRDHALFLTTQRAGSLVVDENLVWKVTADLPWNWFKLVV